MTEPTIARIRPITLVEQAAGQIEALVTTQRLAPGAALPSSAQLAEQLGVSRAVIREALAALDARGVITIANGKHATVRPVTSAPLVAFFQHAARREQHALGEFMEIRKGLEIQSAMLAAQRRTDVQCVELSATLLAMQAALYDLDAFTVQDVALHLQIARATRNQMLVRLLESIRETLADVIRAGRRRRLTTDQVQQVHTLHEAVVTAIIRGDPTAAGQAMEAHFDAIAMSVGAE